MKSITILTACFNEEDNVRELYERVRQVMRTIGRYRYEHIFIDNASRDRTVPILKEIAAADRNVKIIVNARNFGHIRSPMHGLCQASGDALIGIVADLQDPPELIPELLREWEKGAPIVIAVKKSSGENPVMFWIRRRFYRLVNRLSNTETFENFTGFGLYDRKVVDIIKALNDPYPYFRGLIAEIGLPHAEVLYHQPARKHGFTKNNFYTLYDMAMLAITNLSRVPLRLVTFTGFACAFCCVLVSLFYLVYKLLYWNRFSVGVAPLVIGVFFFISIQLVSTGILGEYVGSVLTQVQHRPYVIERERVNWEYAPGEPASPELPAANGISAGENGSHAHPPC
jgi:glycosyltransferase involved in cell wall biosynthesis